ncbi:MAG: NADH-quinone oxidoreductase subunit F, partial [Desulfobacteraceae bacterium]
MLKGPLCHENKACKEKRTLAIKGLTHADHQEPLFFVGAGTCGLGAGAGKTMKAIEAYCKAKGVAGAIIQTGCIGLCAAEPIVDVKLPGRARVSFSSVTEDKIPGLFDQVLKGSIPKEELLGQIVSETDRKWEGVPELKDHPFFKPQIRFVLENCGIIDPENIHEYIARRGYQALSRVLSKYKPEEVCSIIEKSGLRGRGGGGFPTGKKWQMALAMKSDIKYFICNADEGDPGAFMDRAVIEGDPHRLLEGLAVAAYAIGAGKAYVYIRAEYPLAIKHLESAIRDAKAAGLLGHNILDSGFNLEIVIKQGAGAFVCGEETALIHSIEGKRGMPRIRPPYPSTSGLFEKPTVINNVETLANVPFIILEGAEAFNCLGTAGSKGTKVFALSGMVNRTGLVEVPMGTTIRRIVYEIGGGIIGGRKCKGAQMGGPAGGCIPEQYLDVEIDYESLKQYGA